LNVISNLSLFSFVSYHESENITNFAAVYFLTVIQILLDSKKTIIQANPV